MKTAALCALLVGVLALPAMTASPTATPEGVGLSSERLQQIIRMIERRIAAGDLAGTVTIVARKGKVVHHAAQGVMDLLTHVSPREPFPATPCWKRDTPRQ
jgi:CubicO group peptidase (beta-lactamase class C family)